jgi:hypothetical protein
MKLYIFSKYSEQSENHRHPNFYIFYHNHRGYIAQLNAQSPKKFLVLFMNNSEII